VSTMKLSTFYQAIDSFWTHHSLVGIGLLLFCFALGTYLGHKIARNQDSTPLVYGVYFLTLLIGVGIAEKATTTEILNHPFGMVFFGALCGAGYEVYERLCGSA
jgi:hypothetical protein